MRTHLQGIALLGLLAITIWGAAKLASPALGGAFDAQSADDGSAEEDTVELTVDAGGVDGELSADERTDLQFQLLRTGFLDDISQVDGAIGPTTRSAIEAAAAEWGLVNPTDRAVLEHAGELLADVPFFES